jgi:ABC-type glycerol-3-phosphate transport system substrate-binding protein
MSAVKLPLFEILRRKFMKNVIAVLAVAILACAASFAQTQAPAKPRPGQKPAAAPPASGAQKLVKIFVQGDSSRMPDFIEECQKEFAAEGLKLQVVNTITEDYKYNVILATETTYAGAAAGVIALDRKGAFVASVVRSGRVSGKSALNSASKELAKKLGTLMSTSTTQ